MLRTLGTLVKWAVLLPLLVAIVLLAVANDQAVTVHLNPFDKGDPVLKVELALYQVGFLLFVIGVLFGGAVAWRSGARHRRLRARRKEAAVWQSRAGWPAESRSTEEPARASAFLPRPERG